MCFSHYHQQRCIFGFTGTEFHKVLGNRGRGLESSVKQAICLNIDKCDAVLLQVHVLFHWDDHSFFTYHQDDKGKVAVVVNLSPCTTTNFHIAGSGSAVMEKPGEAHIFPTKVYHRSGTAPRRCIKLVFFYDLTTPHDLTDESVPGTSSEGVATQEAEAEVKEDVKEQSTVE